ncbi:MAG: polyhydroxyalkanoate synthesis repressor PhaR [Gammaproteobacteria bacterium]|nr:polyhydroxyalkanoate synthesis repressor PhaR [Gammaproteobacteria bacterium]
MTDTAAKRVIKKYPNRRLYDTNESKYVTLADVRRLVLEDIPFCVIDKKSNEDITRNILLQIIVEQEDTSEPIFTTDVLQQMIGFYGNSASRLAGDFLRNSVNVLYQQQKNLQSQMSNALNMAPMPAAFTELAKRNMEMWQRVQESFFRPVGTVQPEADEKEKG